MTDRKVPKVFIWFSQAGSYSVDKTENCRTPLIRADDVIEWLEEKAQKNRDRLATPSGRQRHANRAEEDDRLAAELREGLK